MFEAHGISVTITSLYDLAERVEGSSQVLTSAQRETLIVTYKERYFERPRETAQEELGEHFDILYFPVSDRLCRGVRNPIEEIFFPSQRRKVS